MLDEFEVYLRGVGFKSQRDMLDRYFIFRKSSVGRFPTKSEVLDHVICLVLIYGDSTSLAADQEISKQKIRLPKPYRKNHGHPCDVPENVMKQPDMEKKGGAEGIEMQCANWGCDKTYASDRNDKK